MTTGSMISPDERKTDRRWMLGTVLTTAALIVSALAVFLG
jgi:hypothetical protein